MKNLRSWLQRVLRRTPPPGTVTVTPVLYDLEKRSGTDAVGSFS